MQKIELKKHNFEFDNFDITCFDIASSNSVVCVSKVMQDYDFENINLEENSIFVDVGAHSGLVSFYAAKMFPKTTFYLYEPNPIMVRAITFGIMENKLRNIHVNPIGLSDATKISKLNINLTNSGGSGLNVNYGQLSVPVLIYNFEDILSIFPKIDYLKMDIEGEEFTILSALEKQKSKFFDRVTNFNLELHDRIYGYANLGKKISREKIQEYLNTFENLNLKIVE
jgi:FkbM family methyltransferase